VEEAIVCGRDLGFPIVVRPSYVLGGRAMEIVFNENDLQRYMLEAVSVSNESPVLLDRFLDNAVEMDVDAICDGKDVLIGGLMQHIELAGVHSGDSACSIPPYDLADHLQDELRAQVRQLATELGVVGLMNTQFAIQNGNIFIIEVNPRASRTAPFVSKATGYPLAKIAARCMAGISLHAQGIIEERIPKYFSVKEAVFPFVKFPGVDPVLGPEMKSTGEVMGVGLSFGEAFAKAQRAAGVDLQRAGKIVISLRQKDKKDMVPIALDLIDQGFELVATQGTAKALTDAGVECSVVNKVNEGRPHIVDLIKNEPIKLIINTVEGKKSISDSFTIRHAALQQRVTYTTTLPGARATCAAFARLNDRQVNRLQSLHQEFD